MAQRKQLPFEQRQSYSERIRQQLNVYLTQCDAAEVLIYYALEHEVDTRPIFNQKTHALYAPRMLADADMQWLAIDANTKWQQGAWGVHEPEKGQIWQPSAQKTVLVCPLVSFDRLGNRLGMGKGYFDRWLDKNRQDISEIIGLAFACQESAVTMPTEAHDEALNTIITEQEIITCRTS